MLKIRTSPRFQAEKEFALRNALGLHLGLHYTIEWLPHLEQTMLHLDSGGVVSWPDQFSESLLYSLKASKPYTLQFDHRTVHCLLGDPELRMEKSSIVLQMDPLAHIFHFLSFSSERHKPEVQSSVLDSFGRILPEHSTSGRNGLLCVPVVDEHTDLIRALINHLDPHSKFHQASHEICVSHDVDHPFMFPNRWQLLKRIARNIVRFDLSEDLTSYALGILNHDKFLESDPWNNFSFLMDASEKRGLVSHFFAMSGGTDPLDYAVDYMGASYTKLIRSFVARGHKLGLHSSFQSMNSPELFKREKVLLEEISRTPVTSNRQHYLRYSPFTTFSDLSEAGFTEDYSIAYSTESGFRAGTCRTFFPFNWKSSKDLRILCTPLLYMENSFLSKNATDDQMIEATKKICNLTKLYGGKMTFLWHNHLLKGKTAVYEQCLDTMTKPNQ